MTRRKRSPSPNRCCKHAAFDIPASLHHFSALSRSLAAVKNGGSHDRENSTIVARAQALSRSPTHAVVSPAARAAPPSAAASASSLPANAKDIRFKYDARQFPAQQEWPQPALNPGAAGHARFLEKQWQTAQATQMVESVRRAAQHTRQQTDDGRDNGESEEPPTAGTFLPGDAPVAPASGMEQPGPKAGTTVDADQASQAPEPTPPRNGQRQRFDEAIEQRRQAIIAKLMEMNPASIATPSSNIQIPTGTAARGASAPPPSPSPATREGGQTDARRRSEQLAALIAKKRAENAANGSLNRWLNARQKHKQAQEAMAKRQSASASDSDTQHESVSQSPGSPSVFSNAAAQPLNHSSRSQGAYASSSQPSSYDMPAPVSQTSVSQDVDMEPLFASPAPSHSGVTAGAPPLSQPNELVYPVDKTAGDNANTTNQLPSPSNSSSSPSEVRWASSPSAQLLMNLAQAAPPSQAPHTFRVPSLTPSSAERRAITSSVHHHGHSSSQGSISVESSTRAQQQHQQHQHQHQQHQELSLMRQQQRQELDLQQYQQMAQAAQAQYVQQQSQQPLPPSPSANNPAYYQVKAPLWEPYNTDKFAMTSASFLDRGPADMLAQPVTATTSAARAVAPDDSGRPASAGHFAVGVVDNREYGTSGIEAFSANPSIYSDPQTAIYTPFGGGSHSLGNFGAATSTAAAASAPSHFVMTSANNNTSSLRHHQHGRSGATFAMPQR